MTKPLTFHPLQTRIFRHQESLLAFVKEMVPTRLIREEMIVAVTSKIVSLAEGRLVSQMEMDKKTLVQKEADTYLGDIGYGCYLTIKEGLLIPSAGIDESNSETGDYILYPKDSYASAELLWRELRKTWRLEKMGVIFTDSHTTPLRRGVTGVCLSYAGFRAVRNLIGTADLFGRELRMTQINAADGLSAGAVLTMGEGAEARPLVVIENADVEFSDEVRREELSIPLQEDLYYPLLQSLMTTRDGRPS